MAGLAGATPAWRISPPGGRWKRQLYRWIDDSDAVLLFWSSNAKNSEWVMKECDYTIRTKGVEFIIPVIIEGPPPVEPPPELNSLHMNDRLLCFM
ncbi:MAG: toll/interleukin-1 receptor domain-containing protein [Pseudomonadota bacterium]